MQVSTQRETVIKGPVVNFHGKWVTAKEYARLHGLAEATLGNWRFQDAQAGRAQAKAGYPQYKRFGRAVRYWLPPDWDAPPAA
jgi:hypothetical protein